MNRARSSPRADRETNARRLLQGALAAALAFGCAGGLRAATEYSGVTEPRRILPKEVELARAAPPSAKLLGHASASCTRVEGAFEGEVWLSDLDCSRLRLRRVLLERAAAVGGTILAEEECTEDDLELECGAAVFVAPRSHAGPGLDGTNELWLDEPEPHLAWRMAVGFRRTGGLPDRQPRDSRLVEHRAVEQLLLGELSVSCREGCSRRALREGARVAAGRLGAAEVAELRCGHARDHSLCVAELGVEAVPEDALLGR